MLTNLINENFPLSFHLLTLFIAIATFSMILKQNEKQKIFNYSTIKSFIFRIQLFASVTHKMKKEIVVRDDN
jgi:hypothetical protein